MNVVYDFAMAIITGIIGGFLVDYFIRKREKKQAQYKFWTDYLFEQMQHNEMFIDSDAFSNMPKFKDGRTDFRDAIFKIMDIVRPENSKEKVFNNAENELCKNIQVAFNELEKWKKENKFWFGGEQKCKKKKQPKQQKE